MSKEIKNIVRQLWLFIRIEYEGAFDFPDEIDSRDFGYGISNKDIRLAAEELGIKPR